MPHSPEATTFIAPSICSLVHRFRFTFLGDLRTAGADFDRFLDIKRFLRLHGGMATQHTLRKKNTVSTTDQSLYTYARGKDSILLQISTY